MADEKEIAGEHEPGSIEITINGTKYAVTLREMTGAQLKALGQVPPAETLFLKRGEGKEVRIEDAETVKLHNNEVFESAPDGSVS